MVTYVVCTVVIVACVVWLAVVRARNLRARFQIHRNAINQLQDAYEYQRLQLEDNHRWKSRVDTRLVQLQDMVYTRADDAALRATLKVVYLDMNRLAVRIKDLEDTASPERKKKIIELDTERHRAES